MRKKYEIEFSVKLQRFLEEKRFPKKFDPNSIVARSIVAHFGMATIEFPLFFGRKLVLILRFSKGWSCVRMWPAVKALAKFEKIRLWPENLAGPHSSGPHYVHIRYAGQRWFYLKLISLWNLFLFALGQMLRKTSHDPNDCWSWKIFVRIFFELIWNRNFQLFTSCHTIE